MSVFRHPKTQNERKSDGAAIDKEKLNSVQIKVRIRSGLKGKSLPTEREDKYSASHADRFRGKKGHSATR